MSIKNIARLSNWIIGIILCSTAFLQYITLLSSMLISGDATPIALASLIGSAIQFVLGTVLLSGFLSIYMEERVIQDGDYIISLTKISLIVRVSFGFLFISFGFSDLPVSLYIVMSEFGYDLVKNMLHLLSSISEIILGALLVKFPLLAPNLEDNKTED